MALHDAKLDEFDVESVLSFSQYVILNVARLWTESTLEQRQHLQRAVFPDGVDFADGEFGTVSTSAIFRVLEATKDEKCQMASLRMLSWNHIMEWLREMDLIQRGMLIGLAGDQDPTGCYSPSDTQGTR